MDFGRWFVFVFVIIFLTRSSDRHEPIVFRLIYSIIETYKFIVFLHQSKANQTKPVNQCQRISRFFYESAKNKFSIFFLRFIQSINCDSKQFYATTITLAATTHEAITVHRTGHRKNRNYFGNMFNCIIIIVEPVQFINVNM